MSTSATPTLEQREKARLRASAWYYANKERAAETRRAWRKANPERRRSIENAGARRRYAAAPGRYIAKARRWQKANPLSCRANQQRRRARKINATIAGAPVTAEGIAQKFRYHGGRCLDCGATKNLTIDHVLPLSRGGLHVLANLAPRCAPCNSRKGVK